MNSGSRTHESRIHAAKVSRMSHNGPVLDTLKIDVNQLTEWPTVKKSQHFGQGQAGSNRSDERGSDSLFGKQRHPTSVQRTSAEQPLVRLLVEYVLLPRRSGLP
jgi:hypothetical protein